MQSDQQKMKPRTRKLPPCAENNSVLERELKLAHTANIIEAISARETPEGFFITITMNAAATIPKEYQKEGVPEWMYILAQLVAEPGKLWYLTTRRERNTPKQFRDLTRLNDYLKRVSPSMDYAVHRGQRMP